jgi:hypothetical protein
MFLATTLLVSGLGGVGCIRLTGPEDLREDLSEVSGVKLRQETGFTVTRSGMWLARKAVKMSGEEEISLRGIRRVEIGVYEVKGLRRGVDERLPLTLDDMPKGWHPMVVVDGADEEVFVMTKHDDDGMIRQLLVVVSEADEWVLVKIKGRLDHIIEDAMRMAFEQGDRPELYQATRRERGMESLDDESIAVTTRGMTPEEQWAAAERLDRTATFLLSQVSGRCEE